MNLTAWPGRGYLPDVGEAVATYWEKVGIRVKRRPVDRAVFSSDFRARAYSGWRWPTRAAVAPEPWEVLDRGAYTKAASTCSSSIPSSTTSSSGSPCEPSYQERVRIMRDEMGPWL